MGGRFDRLDDYDFRHLVDDLADGGAHQELHRLLRLESDGRRNAWFESRDSRGETQGWLANIERARRLAEAETLKRNTGRAMVSAALVGRYALIMSSFDSLASGVLPGLAATLVETGIWSHDQALSYAGRGLAPDQHLRALFTAMRAATGGRLTTLTEMALSTASAIYPDDTRGSLLAELASLVPEAYVREVLLLVRQLPNGGSRSASLQKLAPRLSGELALRAVEIADEVDDATSRTEVLIELAAVVPDSHAIDVWHRALAAALEIRWRHPNGHLGSLALRSIEELASRLPDSLLPDLERAIAVALLDPAEQARAHLSISARQVSEAPIAVFKKVRQAPDSATRCRALAAVSLALAGAKKWGLAIQAVSLIMNGFTRAEALGRLAPHLPSSQHPALIALLGEVEDENEQALPKVLGEFARVFSRPLQHQLSEVAGQIKDPWARVQAFAAIAPFLDGEERDTLLRRALETVRTANIGYTLSDLAPLLTSDQVSEALAIVLKGDGLDSSETGALALRLADVGSPIEALDVAGTIADRRFRNEALATLAPSLPRELLPTGLARAEEIGDEPEQLRAYTALAPFIDPRHASGVSAGLIDAAGDVRRADVWWQERLAVLMHVAARMQARRLRRRALTGVARAIQHIASRNTGQPLAEALLVVARASERLPSMLEPEVVAAAAKVEGPDLRLSVLIALAPTLSPARRKSAWRDAMHTAAATLESMATDRHLASLVKQLPVRLVPDLVDVVSTIPDEQVRGWALWTLIRIVSRRSVQSVAEAVLALEDRSIRAHCLGALIPRLPTRMRGPIVDRELSKWGDHNFATIAEDVSLLAPALRYGGRRGRSLLRRAVDEARPLSNADDRAWFLFHLAPAMPRYTSRLLEMEALVALRETPAEVQAQMLEEAAPYISEAGLPAALAMAISAEQSLVDALPIDALARRATEIGAYDEALRAVAALGMVEGPDILTELLPSLPTPVLRRAADTADGNHDVLTRICLALIERGAVDQASELLGTLPDSYQDGSVIKHLAPVVTRRDFAFLIDRASRFNVPSDRAQALIALAARVPKPRRRLLLLQAVDAACLMGGDQRAERTAVLAAASSLMVDLPAHVTREVWQRVVGDRASKQRADVLADIGALATALAAADGLDAIDSIGEAIEQVARWWP